MSMICASAQRVQAIRSGPSASIDFVCLAVTIGVRDPALIRPVDGTGDAVQAAIVERR